MAIGELASVLISCQSDEDMYNVLIRKGFDEAGVISIIATIDPHSPKVISYCDRVIAPSVNSMFKQYNGKSKFSVGDVVTAMYKKHPENLVNLTILKVLTDQHVTD